MDRLETLGRTRSRSGTKGEEYAQNWANGHDLTAKRARCRPPHVLKPWPAALWRKNPLAASWQTVQDPGEKQKRAGLGRPK